MERIRYIRKFNVDNQLVFTTICQHGEVRSTKKKYTRMINVVHKVIEKDVLIKVNVGSESFFTCCHCAGYEYTEGGYIMNCRYNEHN